MKLAPQDVEVVGGRRAVGDDPVVLGAELQEAFQARGGVFRTLAFVAVRQKLAVSRAEEFTTGSSFHRVLWDDAQHGNSETRLKADAEVRRVVLCSGKVYYDLLEARDERGIDDVYLLRVEQFYPFPAQSMVHELGRFPNADVVWCQEEPKNQGAWTFMEPNLEWVLGRIDTAAKRPSYVGRPPSASPATGLASAHKAQQAALVNDALTLGDDR